MQGAKPDDRLLQRVPPEGEALWGAFIDLCGTRAPGMGASPITHTEVQAWQALHQIQLTSWEVDTLMAMDRRAMRIATDTLRKRKT